MTEKPPIKRLPRGNLVSFPVRPTAKTQLRTESMIASHSEPGTSVMVRGVDGRITMWNPGAEKSYGLSQDTVVGQVSHCLLQTEFPEPLPAINEKLLREQVWEGELIHTLPNGARVKVQSRWELLSKGSGREPVVFEINREFVPIQPPKDVPPLEGIRFHAMRLVHELWRKKWWMMIPVIAVLLFLVGIIHLTNVPEVPPHE